MTLARWAIAAGTLQKADLTGMIKTYLHLQKNIYD